MGRMFGPLCPESAPAPVSGRGFRTPEAVNSMVDTTVEYALGDNGGIVSVHVNVIVDDEATEEEAALCVGAAKAISIEAHRLAEVTAAHAPDDASSLTEPPTS